MRASWRVQLAQRCQILYQLSLINDCLQDFFSIGTAGGSDLLLTAQNGADFSCRHASEQMSYALLLAHISANTLLSHSVDMSNDCLSCTACQGTVAILHAVNSV